MAPIITPTLQFKEGKLYDDIDLHLETIVSAQYIKRKGLEFNPDACAIPKLMTFEYLFLRYQKPIPNYDRSEIEQMSIYLKKESILSIQDAYYVLGHYYDLAVALDKALLSSYRNRELRVFHNTIENYGGSLCSVRNEEVGRAASFVMTGQTGCGKTVAINRLKKQYPTGIRHVIGSYEYIQIPILMTTSKVGNLKELIMSLGNRIDEILDTGNVHVSQVKSKNVGISCNILTRWIKKYHIGIIIIDEIEFLNLNRGIGSFENVISIAEETGCALGLIGNLEAKDMLLKHPRLINRIMQSNITVGCSRSTDHLLFKKALDDLCTYQFGEKLISFTEDIKMELINQSVYNISLLKAIIMDIQYEAVKIFPENQNILNWIREICERDFSDMKAILTANAPYEDEIVLKKVKETVEKIRKNAEEDFESLKEDVVKNNSGDFSTENKHKAKIVEAILQFQGFSLVEIKKAIIIALKENENLEFCEPIEIAKIVKRILEDCYKDNTKKESERTINSDSEENVQEVIVENFTE